MSSTSEHRDMRAVVAASLEKRYKAERRFRRYGGLAVLVAMGFLGILLVVVFTTGMPAFTQTLVTLEVSLDEEALDPEGTRSRDALLYADYTALVRQSLRDLFPEVTGRREKRKLYRLVSTGADLLVRERVLADPSLIGTTQSFDILVGTDIDMWVKNKIGGPDENGIGRLDQQQLDWVAALQDKGMISSRFNWDFFSKGDSREPELAGIWGAMVGSFYSLIVCLVVAFPLGVMAAIYLEEFATKNRWTRLIEVNINNLAAVPSIIFGILGLAVFLNFFGLPRSAPLVGGLVLALMTLPTIVIAARAALQAVPPSIREAALGVGASPVQTNLHHVLPLAMPGILTGTIIGMAQALGETAPLLMIGMVAFIADVPQGITDPAAALPVQVYLWADSPERGFVERTGAAIIVLLVFLVLMNSFAIFMRKKFERKW